MSMAAAARAKEARKAPGVGLDNVDRVHGGARFFRQAAAVGLAVVERPRSLRRRRKREGGRLTSSVGCHRAAGAVARHERMIACLC